MARKKVEDIRSEIISFRAKHGTRDRLTKIAERKSMQDGKRRTASDLIFELVEDTYPSMYDILDRL